MSDPDVAQGPRRLHPISPLFDVVANARQFVLPLFAALAAGRWWFIAPSVAFVAARSLGWIRFTYEVDGDVIRIHEGLIVRKQRIVALDRVQQVDIVSKLRHRVLGVVALRVDTASGASGAELKLDVVTAAEGARLRELLTATSAVGQARTSDATAEQPAATTVAHLSLRQLALAGMTGAQTLVILSLVFSFQEALQMVDVARFRRLIPAGAQTEPLAIAAAVVTLAAVWLALAAAATVLTHYDYTMTTVGGRLRVTRGLFDKREVGGTLARVQAIRVEQSFVRRLLGFASLRVQTAAIPGQTVSRITIPYVRLDDIERVVGQLMPGLPPWPVLERAPRAAFALGLLRRLIPTALVCVPVAWFVRPLGAVALLALPGAGVAALLHSSALGHAWSGATLWARRGGLFRETVIIRAEKAQSARIATSPWQRRGGVATLYVDVAGKGATPKVQDAPVEQLVSIAERLPAIAARDERAARLATASEAG